MPHTVRSLDTLDRCGNAACLDFVNTVHSRTVKNPHEYLVSYADLLRWAQDGGLLAPRLARSLATEAGSRPRQATGVLRRALALRDLLHRVFASLALGREPSPTDLAELNGWLQSILSHRRLGKSEGKLQWAWKESRALECPLWPVVLSAAELLVSAPRRRLRDCPAPNGCGWVFLDTSKNGTRRWCSMRTCGNIAKARRHYQRHSGHRA